MKNITDFINESSINEGMFNSNVPRDIVKWIMGYGGKITPQAAHDFDGAKLQEQEIVDNLNNNRIGDLANYKVMTIKEYAGSKYNTQYDLENGDIVIITDKGDEIFIDLKAASIDSEKWTAGPIAIGSLLAFGKGSTNHYYLCTSNDGKSKAIINANDLYNAWVKDPFLIASKNRTRQISGVKATIYFPNNYSGDTSDKSVYHEDFIGTKWLGTHDFLNSYFKWN
jgi:hypothetical protein